MTQTRNETQSGLTGFAAELVERVSTADRDAQTWTGRGEATAIRRRQLLLQMLGQELVENYGLTTEASESDVLDIARGTWTVDGVNKRLASLRDDSVELGMLKELAEKHGFRLVPEDTVVKLTRIVGEAIVRADTRNSDRELPPLTAANRNTDELRDLRDELRDADIINKI